MAVTVHQFQNIILAARGATDVSSVPQSIASGMGINAKQRELATSGRNWGVAEIEGAVGSFISFNTGASLATDPLSAETYQAQTQGKNGVVGEFHINDTSSANEKEETGKSNWRALGFLNGRSINEVSKASNPRASNKYLGKSKLWDTTSQGWQRENFLPRPGVRAARKGRSSSPGVVNGKNMSSPDTAFNEYDTAINEIGDLQEEMSRTGSRDIQENEAVANSAVVGGNRDSVEAPINLTAPMPPDVAAVTSVMVVERDNAETNALQQLDTVPTMVAPAEDAVVGVERPAIALQRLPINLDLELYQARENARKGRVEQAEVLLRKCMKDWPADGRAYVSLGKLLVRQRRIKEARQVYEDGCQALGGENAFIWQAWAVLEQYAGNLSEARKRFDAAVVADKKHSAAWHGWAVLELKDGNVQRARELLNKGLKNCGANEFLYQTLALIEARSGHLDEARILFRQAVSSNSRSAPSWLAWALLEEEHGEPGTARHLFQKGIEASPKNRYVWQAWALFEAQQGQPETARRLFQRGHELNPKDPALLQAYALFEYSCGFPGTARDLLRRGAEVDPLHIPVLSAWGWIEWKEGQTGRARQLYERAAKLDPTSPKSARIYQAWAVLEEREGNIGLSRMLFKRALKADAENTPAWMTWAAMEERQGNSVRADELRNLCMQQRMDVVETSWDISGVLTPALTRVKQFFNISQQQYQPSYPVSAQDLTLPGGQKLGRSDPDSFDVDAFLAERLPKMYDRRIKSSMNEMNARYNWRNRKLAVEVEQGKNIDHRYGRNPSLRGAERTDARDSEE